MKKALPSVIAKPKVNNRCVGDYDREGPIKCINCLDKKKCLEVTTKKLRGEFNESEVD